MNNMYSCDVTLSSFHNGKTPFLTVSDAQNSHTVRLADAARLAGVSNQTLGRWVEGSQKAPLAALRLFRVAYLGWLPWEGWERFWMGHCPDHQGNRRWLLLHQELRYWWTPERIALIAYGDQEAAGLRAEIRTLRATVNALSTRQAPPIPCAEIIPLRNYIEHRQT